MSYKYTCQLFEKQEIAAPAIMITEPTAIGILRPTAWVKKGTRKKLTMEPAAA